MPHPTSTRSAIVEIKRFVASMILAACLGGAPALSAQNPDSLAALLHSPSFAVRQEAIAGLRGLPPSAWSEQARATVFEQLVSEGQRPLSDAAPDGVEGSETRGTYQIDLVRASLALNDPRALEGMVWLGLQTDNNAISFVAAAGEPAVPFLEQAWAANSWRGPAVLETATNILDQNQSITEGARVRLARIQIQASGFEWALESSVLDHPEFVAAVTFIADSGSDEIQRSTAQEVLPALLSRVSSASPAKLWARERSFTTATCSEQVRGHCEQIQNLWGMIDDHIRGSRWTAASNGLDAFLKAAEIVRADPSRANACRVLLGNAQAVALKVEQLAQH